MTDPGHDPLAVVEAFLERLDRHRPDHGWREQPVNSVFEVDDGRITVRRDRLTAARIHDGEAA